MIMKKPVKAKKASKKTEDRTDVVILLDRSGSMAACRSDHEGGIKAFIEDQKKVPGDVRFTLIQFDDKDPNEVVVDGIPISEFKDFTFSPRGWTPLNDAIFKAIAHVESRVGKEKTKVVFLVVTDGVENCSREATKEMVQKRIAEVEKNGWNVIYLGANVDCFHEAKQIGTQVIRSVNFVNDSAGVGRLYQTLSKSTHKVRRGISGQSIEYSDEDRAFLTGAL